MFRVISLGATGACIACAAFAQGGPLTPVKIDRETGCWTTISDAFEFSVPVKRPGTYVFVAMTSLLDGGETDGRDPVMWLNNGQVEAANEFDRHDSRWSVMKVDVPGDYYLSFAPRAMFGQRGETTVCLRMNDKL